MIIGITGSMGSGKSTVSRIFEKHGFFLIDADELGHNLLKKGTPQYRDLIQYFGIGILDESGNINRARLGDLAFLEKKNYRALNLIMLPPIIREIRKHISENLQKNIVIDAPLLLESKAKELVGKIVVVKASHKNIMGRNRKFSKGRILNANKYQISIAQKVKHADFIINNDGNVKSLENQVLNIIKAVNTLKKNDQKQ